MIFSAGDAANLGDIGQFGCVLAANLLCRMKDPAMLLNSLPSLVVAGGVLVLITPCTWLEEYTPKVIIMPLMYIFCFTIPFFILAMLHTHVCCSKIGLVGL